MALTESIEYDKIEIVGEYKAVHVRKASVIKKDGVELTRSFIRYVLHPGTLDTSDNLVDNPLTKEPDGVTDIPDEVKVTAPETFILSNGPSNFVAVIMPDECTL